MTCDDQASLFERLAGLGLTAKELDFLTHCGLRNAYRLMTGESILTFDQARRLLRHPLTTVSDAVGDAFYEGVDRISVRIQESEQPVDVDTSAIDALEELTGFLRQRQKDRSDGVITPAEKATELERVRGGIRALHWLYQEVDLQETGPIAAGRRR